MEQALDWLSRPEDWDLLPLRERRELGDEVLALIADREDPGLLRRAAAFLREAGWGTESLAAARRAFEAEPSWDSAIALAGAHRYLDQVDDAVRMYDLARRLRPDELSVCLDLGDMLGYEQTRGDEAMLAYEELLAVHPQHPWALPAWLYLQAELGDEEAGEQLADLAPENPQAYRLALAWRFRDLPFWGTLPDGWVDYDVEWGSGMAWELAGRSYHAQFWGSCALRFGRQLRDDEPVLELLQGDAPLCVQLAAAMILSRTDDEWEGSSRRDILLSLLDEGNPAAVVAAGRLAFDEADTRRELTDRLYFLGEERPSLQAVIQPILAWFEPGFLA